MHPELFEIPFVHLTVTSYGVMMVVGFLAAVTLIRRLSRDFTPDPRHITNAALYALIAGVVGARVFFVVHYWHHFQGRSPIAMFAIWQGGLELIGGVVLAIVIIFFYLLWHKLPARRYLDSLAVGLMLALLFGRIGCLLNGCCYGKPTTVFWGIRFPYGSAPYRSQVYPDPARDRPEPHLKLPDEYFTSVRDFFEVDAKFAAPLDRGILSGGLWSQFERKGFNLSRYSKVRTEQPSTRWLITDDQGRYAISKGSAGSLTVDANVRYLRTYQGLTEAQKAAVTKGQYRCLAVHPTQLYTSAAGGLMCLLLYLFW
jgi:prolipoprotein diacylglyceryltransferase